MRPSLAILHIPKAAGTSIRDILAELYGASAVSPFRFDHSLFGRFDRFAELPAAIAEQITAELPEPPVPLTIGHFSLSTLRSRYGTDDIATIVREPRARIISHYSFWRAKRPDQHALWAPYDASERVAALELADVLRDETVASQFDNLTTRLLLQPHVGIDPDRFMSPAERVKFGTVAAEAALSLGFADLVERGTAMFTALGAHVGAELAPRRSNETAAAGRPLDWVGMWTPELLDLLDARTAADAIVWRAVAEATGFATGDGLHAAADAAFMRCVQERLHLSSKAELTKAHADHARTTAELQRVRNRRINRWTEPVSDAVHRALQRIR